MDHTDRFYPPLGDDALFALDVIAQNLRTDPEYLDEAPYPAAVLDIFGKMPSIPGDPEAPSLEDEDKWDRLQRESDKLFRGLTDAGNQLDSRDNAEKMAYFRTATSLLDKIVGIQDRILNLRAVSRFHTTVMAIMEDVLDPGQRTEVMERLKKAINPDD